MKEKMKDPIEVFRNKILRAKRLTHQNWLMTNQISKKDRIQFKHFDLPRIKEKMKVLNPIMKVDSFYFDNIYQN